MGQDRSGAATRPRYGRITVAGVAASITFLSVLGAVGVLPSGPSAAAPAPDPGTSQPPPPGTGTREAASDETAGQPAVPADSGTGRRVVFDMSDQRVWLVGRDAVRRTYLVSGSVTDNLGPGSYAVSSKSRHAVGVDDSGTMGYMVRFARGQRAAIGFHDIPVDDGRLVQTRAQLGTPRSHGCIRQWRPDAKALWDFASVGTPVVVVA